MLTVTFAVGREASLTVYESVVPPSTTLVDPPLSVMMRAAVSLSVTATVADVAERPS